jgi:hypothetical protein
MIEELMTQATNGKFEAYKNLTGDSLSAPWKFSGLAKVLSSRISMNMRWRVLIKCSTPEVMSRRRYADDKWMDCPSIEIMFRKRDEERVNTCETERE